MSNPFRFFKCNIINGCRLSDIERFVTRDEVFYLNAHIACTSRSVNAAINANWIIEISEKEALKYISIPTFAEPVQQKKLEIEEKVVHSADLQTNKAAFDRYQARLKRLEATKIEKEEIVDESLDIEPGKNENENLGALQRIKNRNQKVKNAKKQEKDFIDDIVDVEREGRKTVAAISKQVNENKTTPKVEQVVKRSKNDLKQELEEKLQKKITEKKTVNVVKEEKPVFDEVIGKINLKTVKLEQDVEKPEIKKRGRPPKVNKTEVFMTEVKTSEVLVKKVGRPKKIVEIQGVKGSQTKQTTIVGQTGLQGAIIEEIVVEKKQGRPKKNTEILKNEIKRKGRPVGSKNKKLVAA